MENSKASAAWPRKKRSFEWVCEWSLETCLLQFTRAAIKINLPPDRKLLTPSQAANVLALQNAMLWFSVAGGGAALLAMLLRGRGRRMIRRALACVGLASSAAIHCVITWLLGVTLVTAPNDNLLVLGVISAVAFIFFAAVDVNASLVLLGRPGWDWEEEESSRAWPAGSRRSRARTKPPRSSIRS